MRPYGRLAGGGEDARRAHHTLIAVLLLLMGVALLTGFSAPSEAASDRPRDEPRRPPAVAAVPAPPLVIEGTSSWYGEFFRGRPMSCGGDYDPDAPTAAHRSLPCGSRLLVEHAGRSIEVTVTDRGPYVSGRVLDLSRGAFAALAAPTDGLINVRATLLPGR